MLNFGIGKQRITVESFACLMFNIAQVALRCSNGTANLFYPFSIPLPLPLPLLLPLPLPLALLRTAPLQRRIAIDPTAVTPEEAYHRFSQAAGTTGVTLVSTLPKCPPIAAIQRLFAPLYADSSLASRLNAT